MDSKVQSVNFDPGQKRFILRNLRTFQASHTTFRTKVFQNGASKFIKISGSICALSIPFEINLYDTYPIQPPEFMLIKQSQPFNSYPFLSSDGHIKLDQIIGEWNPESDLNALYEIINNFLNEHPPIGTTSNATPSGSDQAYEEIIAEAESIISSRNEAVQRLYENELELQMLRHLNSILNELSSQYGPSSDLSAGRSVSQDELLDKYITPDLSKFPQNIQKKVIMKANEDGSQDTINAFLHNYENNHPGKTHDFLVKYQSLNNEHFKKFVWPQLT